eukprot:TRINITY_DN4402_c0_g1_i1.p1 TRINITY_DN4402_c0_g1~~TRINITY_DN4402_c0_g1_i1.p1  ORF type:complete len:387 (+),score=78.07 TRINITY_DN4402_c0_g1_i1:159-1319(+)
MSSSEGVQKTKDGVVILKYEDLTGGKDLTKSIEEAFGYSGIGLLIVSGIPDLPRYRENLLSLAPVLAELPQDKLEKIIHAPSHYSFGWSHGKEILVPGKYDTFKGSFYANPQYDTPTDDPEMIKNYPEVCLPNIWPKDDLPQLENAFKDLGRLVINVGKLVAKQCDNFVSQNVPSFQPEDHLEKIITDSRACKARLLHYFAVNEEDSERNKESWCGWHNDHGSLTGLCPAIYYTKKNSQNQNSNNENSQNENVKNENNNNSKNNFEAVPCPDANAGLWVRTRDGKEFKVAIPADCLGFQIGECSQVNSGGLLRATPHAVQAIRYPESIGISRETFAVFMQPNFDKVMKVPGADTKSCAVERFSEGMNFGEFSKATIEMYYQGKGPM